MTRFAELLLKLNSMNEAISKRKSLDKLGYLDVTIGLHILKVLLFKDEANSKHCDDLDTFIKDCRKFYKRGSVKASYKEVYEELSGIWDTNINDFTELVNDELKDYIINLQKTGLYYDYKKTQEILLDILKIISEWIVKDKVSNIKNILLSYTKY